MMEQARKQNAQDFIAMENAIQGYIDGLGIAKDEYDALTEYQLAFDIANRKQGKYVSEKHPT